jgi:hypothetical protein
LEQGYCKREGAKGKGLMEGEAAAGRRCITESKSEKITLDEPLTFVQISIQLDNDLNGKQFMFWISRHV